MKWDVCRLLNKLTTTALCTAAFWQCMWWRHETWNQWTWMVPQTLMWFWWLKIKELRRITKKAPCNQFGTNHLRLRSTRVVSRCKSQWWIRTHLEMTILKDCASSHWTYCKIRWSMISGLTWETKTDNRLRAEFVWCSSGYTPKCSTFPNTWVNGMRLWRKI